MMQLRSLLMVVLAGAGAICAGPGRAAPTTLDTAGVVGEATATVVAPIVVSHVPGAVLGFGRFTAGSGGTVTVTPSGAGAATGGVAFVGGGGASADSFAVSGDPGRSFAIVTTSGTVASATATMAFSTVPSAAVTTLDGSGARTFTVGGTLTVPANAAAGNYSGSYSASVTYN